MIIIIIIIIYYYLFITSKGSTQHDAITNTEKKQETKN